MKCALLLARRFFVSKNVVIFFFLILAEFEWHWKQVFAVAVLLDELLDTGCDSPLAPDRASDDASSTNVNSSGSSSNNNTSNSDTTSTALAGSGKLGGVPVRAHASTLDSVRSLFLFYALGFPPSWTDFIVSLSSVCLPVIISLALLIMLY